MISTRKTSLFFGQLIWIAMGLIVTLNTSCTKEEEKTTASAATLSELTIEKNSGINVGESEAIWAVDQSAPPAYRIYRVGMDALKGYPTSVFSLKIDDNLWQNGGSRTYVSEWGLLIGRGGGDYIPVVPATNPPTPVAVNGAVGLYLQEPGGASSLLFKDSQTYAATRATPFAYRIMAGGKENKFIGLSYVKSPLVAPATGVATTWVVRIERFLRNDAAGKFERLRPIEISGPDDKYILYTGFLWPDDDNCSPLSTTPANCSPKFFSQHPWNRTISWGVNLNVDSYPYTKYVDDTATPPIPAVSFRPSNHNFNSTSHPATSIDPNSATKPFGTINVGVYSMAGDPTQSPPVIFRMWDKGSHRAYTAFDRVNQLVYHIPTYMPRMNGTVVAETYKSRIHLLKRECFVSEPDCDPTTPAPAGNPGAVRSRVFTDVGTMLGSSSDLGNGCIAIIGSEVLYGARADAKEGIYTACVRDPYNLDKGIIFSKVAEVQGAFYMYNDFTGATLYSRDVRPLFDFTERRTTSIQGARLYWSPKLGFSPDAIIGLQLEYRCFTKGVNPAAIPFKPIVTGKAFVPIELAGCTGAGINQVELKITKLPNRRYTRFQTLSVTAAKGP